MTYTARRSGPAGPRGERFLALVEEARERHRRLYNAAVRREEAELRCYCPGDCGCRPRWTGDVPRNVCGCRQHEYNARVSS